MTDLTINAEEVYTIITDFIQTYIRNSKCPTVVLGLSGGIDSSVAAVLCAQTLGKQKVLGLFLPDKTTPPLDHPHLKNITHQFQIHYNEIDITPLIEQIKQTCVTPPDKMTLANLKARTRMILLYEYANMTNSIVCGTSNKSEILIGYFTKYGDGAADIQPLGDLYKTQVRQLAQYLKFPASMITKPPTAGLWRGQTDEKELGMNYETLDKILHGLELKLSDEKIQTLTQVSHQEINRIRTMRKHSQHKRRSPLIPKIGIRTPGLDWRSPVQEG
jgi:NAD+ synthase